MTKVVSGKTSQINNLNSVLKFSKLNKQDAETLKNWVVEDGLVFLKEDGKLYLGNGKHKLSELKPIVDEALSKAEKAALNAAFSTGRYAIAANGVVVHGADSKIDDASLKVVQDGKIVASYLSDIFDADNNKIKLDVIPAEVRQKVTYVNTYNDLQSVTEEQKLGLVFVIDASGDDTVTKGSALYGWNKTGDSQGEWKKISEQESMDIDISTLQPTHENVEKAGAVMYDHPVAVGGMSLVDYQKLTQKKEYGPEEQDPEHKVTLKQLAITGSALAEVPAPIEFEGDRTAAFKVVITPNKCKLKGFEGEAETEVTSAKELQGTLTEVNQKLANVKCILGTETGSITVVFAGETSTIPTTVA